MKRDSHLPTPGYHPVTRWLHAGLVLGVLIQLTFAALMSHPNHHDGGMNGHDSLTLTVTEQSKQNHHQGGHEVALADSMVVENAHIEPENNKLGALFMQAHQIMGMVLVVIVLLNVIWAIVRRGKPCKRQLSVLVSNQHWRQALTIAKDVPLMLLSKRPLAEPGNSLSLIIEMLGLLTMAAMATTGFMIWSLWGGLESKVSPLIELLMQVHSGFAMVLLVYLSGHVSMALLHLRSGDSVFSRILPFRQKNN